MIEKGINFRISVIFIPRKLQQFLNSYIIKLWHAYQSYKSLLMNSSNGINIVNIKKRNTEMIQTKLCGGYSIFY